MDDTSFDVEEGFDDAVIIGASSMKHVEESLVDLEKGPLPEEVVLVINAGWEKQARYLEGIGIE